MKKEIQNAVPKTLRGKAPVISALRLCPTCGAEIPPDAPEGGCPRCLLEIGLDVIANHAHGVRHPRTAAAGFSE
jgi:hypothetical protein